MQVPDHPHCGLFPFFPRIVLDTKGRGSRVVGPERHPGRQRPTPAGPDCSRSRDITASGGITRSTGTAPPRGRVFRVTGRPWCRARFRHRGAPLRPRSRPPPRRGLPRATCSSPVSWFPYMRDEAVSSRSQFTTLCTERPLRAGAHPRGSGAGVTVQEGTARAPTPTRVPAATLLSPGLPKPAPAVPVSGAPRRVVTSGGGQRPRCRFWSPGSCKRASQAGGQPRRQWVPVGSEHPELSAVRAGPAAGDWRALRLAPPPPLSGAPVGAQAVAHAEAALVERAARLPKCLHPTGPEPVPVEQNGLTVTTGRGCRRAESRGPGPARSRGSHTRVG